MITVSKLINLGVNVACTMVRSTIVHWMSVTVDSTRVLFLGALVRFADFQNDVLANKLSNLCNELIIE